MQTYNSGDVATLEKARLERNWSVAGERRAVRLRGKAEIIDEPVQIRSVVLDLSKMNNIDTTGLTALKDLKADVERFGGKGMGIRLVGLSERVRERFGRFGWGVYDVGSSEASKKSTAVYASVEDAVFNRGRSASSGDEDGIEPLEVLVVGSEKEKV